MSQPDRRPRYLQGVWLAVYAREVEGARARLRNARGDGVRERDQQALRADLLATLEHYAAAITSCGVPVPHRLRAEIELYQRLRGRR